MAAEESSDRLDLRHAATDRALIVVVPERQLFAIDGVGSPGGADYRLATATLRSVTAAVRSSAEFGGTERRLKVRLHLRIHEGSCLTRD